MHSTPPFACSLIISSNNSCRNEQQIYYKVEHETFQKCVKNHFNDALTRCVSGIILRIYMIFHLLLLRLILAHGLYMVYVTFFYSFVFSNIAIIMLQYVCFSHRWVLFEAEATATHTTHTQKEREREETEYFSSTNNINLQTSHSKSFCYAISTEKLLIVSFSFFFIVDSVMKILK